MVTPLGSRYELDTPVGSGATGRVWRGRDTTDGSLVAIKVLRSELADDPEVIARFVRERGVVTGIRSDRLVAVHDLVVEGGTAAIVMDWIPGADLRATLASGPLAPAHACALAADVLEALAAVHDAGVVHRDVKPENVLIDGDGRARLTDLGIARVVHGSSLTRRTGVIGTPEYIAPEVAGGSPATPAADVYGAGVLLFEMLAGRPPHTAENPLAVLRAAAEQPRPSLPGLPSAVDRLLDEMLAKSPAARPPAAELAAEARRVAADREVAIAPALAPLALASPDSAGDGATERPTFIPERGTQVVARHGDAVPAAEVAPEPRRGGRRRAVIGGVVALVVIVVAGALAFVTAGADKGPASVETRKPVSFDFAPAVYTEGARAGLVVNRTWTLDGDRLTGNVVLANSATGPNSFDSFEEPLPPSAVPANAIPAIETQPDAAVAAAGDVVIATFPVSLPPGAQQSLSYGFRVDVEGEPRPFLQKLAQEHERVVRANDGGPAVVLASLAVAPDAAAVAVAGTVQMTVTGTMSDGAAAPAEVLAGVAWRSQDPAVALVDATGLVVGVSPGATAVIGAVAGVEGTARVTVNAAPTTTAPRAVPPPTTQRGGSGATTPTSAPSTVTAAPPTTAAVRAPGAVVSVRSSDPVVAAADGTGTPTAVSVSLSWQPPSDSGGESPGFVIRCTLMVGSQVYTGSAGHQCKGGAEVASAGAGASSATVTTDAVQPGPSTWLRWEVAARNSAGTGAYGAATVRTPNLVGTKSWVAYPLARAVGLAAAGGQKSCSSEASTICDQGIEAGRAVEAGLTFVLYEP